MRNAPKSLLITTAISAALLSGCAEADKEEWTSQEPVAVCRDKDGKRAPDDNCTQSASNMHSGAAAGFMWYYLSRGSRVPPMGQTVTGGSTTRVAGTIYKSSQMVKRGGFGSASRSGSRSFGG
jgi:hypothetical protein